MALNITNVYEEYEKELKRALTCQWCAGLLNKSFATCHNCGGHNMDAKNNSSITAGATDFQGPRNVKLNHENVTLCAGGGGAGGAGIVVEYNVRGYGGGAGIHVTGSKK